MDSRVTDRQFKPKWDPKLKQKKEDWLKEHPAVHIDKEQARLINYALYTSWSDLTEEEKITAERIMNKVNKLFKEDDI